MSGETGGGLTCDCRGGPHGGYTCPGCLGDVLRLARRIVEQTRTTCTCPDEPHQNALHDLAHDLVDTLHDCGNCRDCLHDGNRCCGCYDEACCRAALHPDPNPDA